MYVSGSAFACENIIMRIIVTLILVLFISACHLNNEKSKDNPPVFINYASQVLRTELKNTILLEEKIEFRGHNITNSDSTLTELEISIKDVAKVPFTDELPNLGQKIGVATKTVLADTNQYQRYKIIFIGKKQQDQSIRNTQSQIIVYPRDLTSIPLNSIQFKDGMLKR